MTARLDTAEKAIKVHRARVMHKLRVRTLADLVHLADRVGIVATPRADCRSCILHRPGTRL